MKRDIAASAHGIARVKKFAADQDTKTGIPYEVVEREFRLSRNQAREVRAGRAQVILQNGKVEVKGNKGETIK